MDDAEYDLRLSAYIVDLHHPAVEIVQKQILTGPVAAHDHANYFLLRKRVASTFDVQAVEVILVGSCRTGFSIVDKSDKGRQRYSPMRSASDLDLVIVSATLFDKLWQEVFQHAQADRAFATSARGGNFR